LPRRIGLLKRRELPRRRESQLNKQKLKPIELPKLTTKGNAQFLMNKMVGSITKVNVNVKITLI
jgi:hypothetical protein